MNLDAVINQLRSYAPIFASQVAGAADFADGLASTVWPNLASPAAYVIPLDDEAAANTDDNALYQIVTERIGVVVEFDNSKDRRGQTVSTLFEPTKVAIFAAILNWRGIAPGQAPRGLEYAGGRVLQFDRARLFYQFEFTLEVLLDTQDGWQVTGPALTEIRANSNPGDPYPQATVILPQ